MRVCVFCGSATGSDPRFTEHAVAMGETIAAGAHTLVYGGGSVGLMGVIADAALAAGGEVIGVIPGGLFGDEIAHPALTELHTVESLAERKALMAELSDAFVALPGGYGTLDELFEMITWTQLGVHAKPCGVLNAHGFFDDLLRFLDNARSTGFVRRSLLVVDDDPAALLVQLAR